MVYRPQHRTQLWRPVTGQTDCGPRTWQHGLDFARRDHRVPGIDRMRRISGDTPAGPTNVYDADRVFEEFGVRYQRKVNAEWDVAVDALRRGNGLHLCVAYGVITRLQPAKSGDRNFTGGHSIWVQELKRTREGRRVALDFDSLYDGRRRSIPDEPQWIRLSTLRAACQEFSGHDYRWWGGIVIPTRGTSGPGDDIGDDDETVIPADEDAHPVEGTPMPGSDEGDTDDDMEEVEEDDEGQVEEEGAG